jgi:hypothetical protein
MGRRQKQYHYIYKTTNVINNKYYIGMHSTNNLEDGYLGSGKRLWFSINYYGKENFIKEILEFLPDRESLKEREKELVNKQLLKEDLCMNLMIGGEGGRGFTSEEQRLNAFKSNERQKELRETNPDWVKKRSGKFVKTIKKLYDDEVLERKYFYNWTDKNHSNETKLKMSEIKSGTGVGETNSQYGTCWITKDNINKKIKNEDLSNWENEGWIKGRYLV